MKEKISFDAKDIDDNKAIAALSYLWILCLVPLLIRRNSPFAQAHAKQGLVLFIVEIIGSLIFWIPFFGWLLWLVLVVVSLFGLVKALQGEYWEIPGIKKLMDKIKL